jgi:thiol-disulfide isomerase/thioredoxin
MTRRTMLGTIAGAAAVAAATVPRPAGEFGFELPGGKPALISQWRGKAVMLAFFSTTCPHCQDTSRMMQRLYNEYGSKGFAPVGICFNDMAKMLTPEFIQRGGLTYQVGYSLPDPVLTYIQHPAGEIPYVPMILFIDKKGVVQAQFTAGKDKDFFEGANQENRSRAMIEKMLGVAPTKPASTVVKKTTAKKAS